MDYEHKYKEALERAKKELNTCGSTNCDAARQIFRLFPELAKSEDEKIRKELITYCRNIRCVTEEVAERIAKWIAWLEKQEEKIPANSAKTCKPFDYENANIQQKDYALPPQSERKSLQQVFNDMKNDVDYFVRYAEAFVKEQEQKFTCSQKEE